MTLPSLALGLLSTVGQAETAPLPDVYALRVGRAETIANGTLEHAVVLVESGKITVVGEDLPIERGIAVVDLPHAVLLPGLVVCRSRIGLDSRGGTGARAEARVTGELFPALDVWEDVLEHGVTTLGLYPAGAGIPGQAAAIRPAGETVEEMLVADSAYLWMTVASDRNAKKLLTDAFEKVDKYLEKVEKEREKFVEAQEKKKGKKKEEEKKEEEPKPEEGAKPAAKDEKPAEPGDGFEPPVPDPDVLPLVRLLAGDLRAVIGFRKAGDYLHLLDVLGEREFEWDLQIDLRDELDLFYIADKLGERAVRVVMDPVITAHPGTRRDRNLPAELATAGAKLALVPRVDSPDGCEAWRHEVGQLVKFGLDRQVALRAMTLEPAAVLGLADRLGSLEAGKDANFVLYDGDPFEPGTERIAVVLEGELVVGELQD
ncbi:MAG TPA: amidohydrolase family protein [Planctomycetota bacterium]|nr:amidohydrolase family protein [Planctomycetota bacterium]